MMDTPMYVTGYYGGDLEKISVPRTLEGNGAFKDVALFNSGEHRWDWIYLGNDKDGHSLSIFFSQEQGVLETVIGTYQGSQEKPGPLDSRYASAQPLFFDGRGHLVMQFNLMSYISSAEKK